MCHSSPESSLSAVIACNKKWEYDMTIQEMEVTMLHDVQPEYALKAIIFFASSRLFKAILCSSGRSSKPDTKICC
jgi:hypothetical protein